MAIDFLMIFDFSIGYAERTIQSIRKLARRLDQVDIEANQCRLIRDIYRNPAQTAAFHPSWLTTTVVELAHLIHEQAGYDQMPLLGDALEEAGCSDPSILDHCRLEKSHVRGCWVVDALIVPDLSRYRPPDYPRETL